MNTLYFDFILISIGLIALLWFVFKIIHTDTPLERALKQLEEERKANIKWQINRNLAARKRKDLICKLISEFDVNDIKVIDEADSCNVIIKIDKSALIEREVK